MNKLTAHIKLTITDDQTLFREGLCNLIAKYDFLQIVASTSSGPSLLQELAKMQELPDVALIDMDMPEMNGIELNQALQMQYPAIKVIILSVHNQPMLIAQMIQAGADAYLEKNCESQELLTAINDVHNTGFYINRQVMEAIQKAAHLRKKTIKSIHNIHLNLTEREKEILNLTCKDFSTVEIGEKLFISTRTVEGHRQNLLIKTGCRNIAGLVLFALKHGIYQLEEL